MPYVGHAAFQQAREAAGLTLGAAYSTDWGQNDILGEAVLAVLEGRNAVEAVRAHRAREKGLTAMRTLVHDIGWDGRRLVVQRFSAD